MIRAARRVSDEQAAGTHDAAYCLRSWDDDGSLNVRAKLPAEDGAILIKALEAARDALREQRRQEEDENPAFRGSAEPDSDDAASSAAAAAAAERWPTSAECMSVVAEWALDGARSPASVASPRFEVVVHMLADGHTHLGDGPGVAPGTAGRLTCDSAVVPLLEAGDGSVLSVGRRTRTIPPAMRRALEVRDGGCRFPGCEQRRFTDGHHIRHWADGGETELENLVLLCRRHHRIVHEGRYSVEVTGNGELKFRSPHGWALDAAPPLPEANAPPKAAAAEILTGTGERMHLGDCVDRVLEAVAPP